MKKSKILIVDDEPDIREIITECLKDLYEINEAANGEEALKACLSFKPDCIISDISMPKVDGLQFLEQLKLIGLITPFILVTAYADTKKVKRAWDLGAFDFLEKPINFEVLRSTVQKALIFSDSPPLDTKSPDTAQVTLDIDQETLIKFLETIKTSGKTLSLAVETLMRGSIK
jgi:DNA-binding NtrC family response regulator